MRALGLTKYLQVLAALVCAVLVQACGGGGGGGAPGAGGAASGSAPVVVPTVTPVTPPTTPPTTTPSTVVVSGTATFASVPNNLFTGALNYIAVVNTPARGVTVQAVSGTTVLASATTSTKGEYTFTLPANTNFFVRLRAEMINTTGAATWNVTVKDNTAGDPFPLWVVDGATGSSGSANSTRSITAGSGWTGSNYGAPRAAGPFAILDTIYSGMAVVSTVQPSGVAFPPLSVFWSPNNNTTTSATGDFTTGELGTSFFQTSTVDGTVLREIYVLGKEGDDTDEYDNAVVAHEYGHYLQSAFSNDHSLGGTHAALNKLDMTVAFSEGWGTAWSSIMRGSSIYTDSFGLTQAQGFSFSLTTTLPTDTARGWYREDSIDTGLYALFQRQGFPPIWTALTGPMATSQNALSTIFSFAAAVRNAANGAVTAALNAILSAQNIFIGAAADQWGAGELNNGGDASNLPIYRPLAFNTPTAACFINSNVIGSSINKLGSTRYYRATLSAAQAGLRTITANFPQGRDLDFDVFQNRKLLMQASANSLGLTSESLTLNLSAGEVIIRVSDFITTPPLVTNCATLMIQ